MSSRFWGWTAMLTIKAVEFGALYAWQATGNVPAGRALVFWLWFFTALSLADRTLRAQADDGAG